MVDKGRASRDTIEYLIQDIKEFMEAVRSEVNYINKDTKDLNSYWDDKQYDNFVEIVNTLTTSLSNQLSSLEDVNANLKKKLSILG